MSHSQSSSISPAFIWRGCFFSHSAHFPPMPHSHLPHMSHSHFPLYITSICFLVLSPRGMPDYFAGVNSPTDLPLVSPTRLSHSSLPLVNELMHSLIGVREEPACQIADAGATRLARGGHDAARYSGMGRTVERRQLKTPKDFGVFCLFGENFVTPFSTLAMIKGSLPTNSTTPDRLRRWARPSDDDFTGFGGGKA